jgi:hypothetical protein
MMAGCEGCVKPKLPLRNQLPMSRPFALDGPSVPELMFWPDDCNPPDPWPDDCDMPQPTKRYRQVLLWPEVDPD